MAFSVFLVNMATFAELCKEQILIESSIRHHKKGRKKTLEYVNTKLQELEGYWRDFAETDEDIHEHADLDSGHTYFSDEVFEKVKKEHIRAKERLEVKAEDLAEKGARANITALLVPTRASWNMSMGETSGLLDNGVAMGGSFWTFNKWRQQSGKAIAEGIREFSTEWQQSAWATSTTNQATTGQNTDV